MSTWLEKKVGFLLAILSLIWAGYYLLHERVITAGYLGLGPMQIFMLGLLAWLHGKYRRTVTANRT